MYEILRYNGILFTHGFASKWGPCMSFPEINRIWSLWIYNAEKLYFRYTDDISHIYSWSNDLTKIMERLNNIEPITDFTYELQKKIPYLSWTFYK